MMFIRYGHDELDHYQYDNAEQDADAVIINTIDFEVVDYLLNRKFHTPNCQEYSHSLNTKENYSLHSSLSKSSRNDITGTVVRENVMYSPSSSDSYQLLQNRSERSNSAISSSKSTVLSQRDNGEYHDSENENSNSYRVVEIVPSSFRVKYGQNILYFLNFFLFQLQIFIFGESDMEVLGSNNKLLNDSIEASKFIYSTPYHSHRI